VDTLHVEFDLVDGDDESIKQHIQFLKDVPEGTNAYKMEFFDVECTNTNECNGWRLWWGNMENTDGAVLTVKK
jgi:hypothetical protein